MIFQKFSENFQDSFFKESHNQRDAPNFVW